MRLIASLLSVDPRSRMTILFYAGVHLVLMTLLLVALIAPASAQDVVAASSTVFDFGPWVSALIELLAPAILSLVGLLGLWILKRLSSYLGVQIDAERRAALNQALERSVAFALEKVGDHARGGIPIDLRHDALVTAAAYAQRSVPDAIKHFGIDGRRLQEMLEARLEGLVIEDGEAIVSEPVGVGSVRSAPIS